CALMPSRRVRPRLACSTASPVPRRGKTRWVRPCRLAASEIRGGSPAPPSFSLPKRHHSSPGKSLLPTAVRPPAEGNSGSRSIDRDPDQRTTEANFPIKVNGEIVGAIGVSGAPAEQNDVDCARAALALVPNAAAPTE